MGLLQALQRRGLADVVSAHTIQDRDRFRQRTGKSVDSKDIPHA
jgi:hypothetical protein